MQRHLVLGIAYHVNSFHDSDFHILLIARVLANISFCLNVPFYVVVYILFVVVLLILSLIHAKGQLQLESKNCFVTEAS